MRRGVKIPLPPRDNFAPLVISVGRVIEAEGHVAVESQGTLKEDLVNDGPVKRAVGWFHTRKDTGDGRENPDTSGCGPKM